MAMVSLDPATLACVSATPLSTTGGVFARGLVATSDTKSSGGASLLLTETRAGFERRVRALSYLRCDDGIVDPADGRCVCFVGGKQCPARGGSPASASEASLHHASGSNTSPADASVRTIVSIALLAVTGVLLVLTIVFVALFVACM